MMRGVFITSCKTCPFRVKAYSTGCVHPLGFREIKDTEEEGFPPFCPLDEVQTIVVLKDKK